MKTKFQCIAIHIGSTGITQLQKIENALASIDTNLRYNMSFTKKEKAINPKAKCPAIVAIFI